jgi:hypothetical protein
VGTRRCGAQGEDRSEKLEVKSEKWQAGDRGWGRGFGVELVPMRRRSETEKVWLWFGYGLGMVRAWFLCGCLDLALILLCAWDGRWTMGYGFAFDGWDA